MICHQCQRDRKETDFFKSSICYSCTFKNKMTSLVNKDVKEIKKCKICKDTIPASRLIYWKACYCSEECARRGKELHNKNYWVRKCQAPKIQRGFKYGKSKQV